MNRWRVSKRLERTLNTWQRAPKRKDTIISNGRTVFGERMNEIREGMRRAEGLEKICLGNLVTMNN